MSGLQGRSQNLRKNIISYGVDGVRITAEMCSGLGYVSSPNFELSTTSIPTCTPYSIEAAVLLTPIHNLNVAQCNPFAWKYRTHIR